SRRWIQFLLQELSLIIEKRGNIEGRLPEVEQKMLTMFHYTLWGKGLDDLDGRFQTIAKAIYWVISEPALFKEFIEMLEYQYKKINFADKRLDELGFDCGLDLHCAYTMDQIMVALGKHTEIKRCAFREGVLYLPEWNLDVFFVTLNKS